MTAPPLNDEQKEFIKAHYLIMSFDEMSRQIQKSTAAIGRYMRKEGLIVPPEILQERKEKGRFKKNFTPHNKGKKMPEEVYEKVKHTFFKKKNQPHNTLYDGAKTRRGCEKYWYIRLACGHWQLLSHYLYESHYGAVPPEHKIVFRDGNPDNVTIENLECISDAELMRRNSNANREKIVKASKQLYPTYVAGVLKRGTSLKNEDIPDELIKLKTTELLIKRQLKSINNESK